MTNPETCVIVGASLAGAKAAETLRKEGFDGRVVLFGEEPVRPYERPPLSKEYLRGEKGFDFAAVHTEGFYDEQGIELHTSTRVTGLDASSSEVVTAAGERLHYDRLLLATGSEPRKLTAPGADLEGVLYLRTVADSDAIREVLARRGRVIVVGAGWTGCEVAASARQMGCQVALVETGQAPLQRVLGAEVAEIFRALHAEHGVEMHFGASVARLVGSSAAGRSVTVAGVELADGRTLEGDAVVVGVGILPRLELAMAAGLAIDNGVAVDEHLRSSVPTVFAAGDVAASTYPRYRARIRLEHWSAALNQGPLAAESMMGRDVAYDKTPYFFSDQYDLGMEYRGWAPAYDRVVFRGQPASGKFLTFWMKGSRVCAAMNCNTWDAGDAIEALLASPGPVGIDRLADPDVPLAELV